MGDAGDRCGSAPGTHRIMMCMDLRPELLPPQIEQWRIKEISGEISRIADMIHSGQQAEADLAITAFNAEVGHDYGPTDFLEYNGSRSIEEFALEAARPAWPRTDDVSRAELIEVVRRIQTADPDTDDCADTIADAALAYRPISL